MQSAQQPTALVEPDGSRLYFLDWVRIIAFLLLILYHTGMYYVTWDWHVKSPMASGALEPFMMLTSPWRLSLLFLVSGVASSFMLMKRGPHVQHFVSVLPPEGAASSLGATRRELGVQRFLAQRSVRLLVPLVFGMLVVVPPQAYLEVVEKLGYSGSYADFMGLYLHAYHGFCKDGHCLTLPTWNHLWFVPYLWVYSLLLGAAVWALGRSRFAALSDALGRHLTGWKIVVLPLAVLALARVALFSRFPATHALVDDWYNHANYFPLFLLGALLAQQRGFWSRVDGMRWASLGTALTCWAALIIYFALPDNTMDADVQALVRDIQRVVYALCAWSAMLAACGFAHRHLQFDNAQRRYLTRAVFPVYILHQTLIVVMAHALKPVKLAPGLEGLLLALLTLTLSLGAFEVIRRLRWLQPLFGVAGVGAGAQRPVQARQANPLPAAPATV
jgi:surface polysaccharide O-acyltransferase-like enzyme